MNANWKVYTDPQQGEGTTAFSQYAEGNNGKQFDIKIVDPSEKVIAIIPAAHLSGCSKINAHKNAALIASAPDLLAAGIAARKVLAGLNLSIVGVDALEAFGDLGRAIDKATGE